MSMLPPLPPAAAPEIIRLTILQGEAKASAGAIRLPLRVFPAADAEVPANERIYRNVPTGISILTWPELILQDLSTLTGPQIASIVIAGGGLIGLAQLWRRRRRME